MGSNLSLPRFVWFGMNRKQEFLRLGRDRAKRHFLLPESSCLLAP